jgi:hypothetical protein
VGDYYSQLQQGNQSPTPEQTSSTVSSPDSSGQGILSKIRDFLFPIVGDIGNDISGKSQKSILQQVGDFGLSALPFIPGLGEAGEAARGGEAAIEGGSGILDALKGLSPATKGIGVGYGAGVASNLSQGKSIGQSLTPGLNTIGGAALGGLTPKIIDALSGFRQTLSGISPEVANAFKNDFTEADLPEVEKYNDIAKQRASGAIVPSVENTAADNLDKAAGIVDEKASQAGKAVGVAKENARSISIPKPKIAQVGSDFNDEVKNRFGLELSSDNKGNVSAIPTSSYTQINDSDKARIEAIGTQLNKLYSEGGNVKNATEIIGNIDRDLNYNKKPYGEGFDVLDGLMSKTRKSLNENVIRPSSEELANANDRNSALSKLQGDIREIAGNKLQRGELLMKRIFSSNSADSISLFNKIKDETGIDLTKHAIMAKNAVDTFGGNADKSLLQKTIEGATQGKGGVLSSLLGVGKGIATKTVANPETIGKNLIKGKSGGLLKSLLTKSAIEAGSRGGSLIGSLVGQ